MFAWIAENASTLITSAVLVAVTAAAVFSLARDKKKGRGACTGNCASCGMCRSESCKKMDASEGSKAQNERPL